MIVRLDCYMQQRSHRFIIHSFILPMLVLSLNVSAAQNNEVPMQLRSSAAALQALESVGGRDRSVVNARMTKANYDLALLYQEHKAYKSRGSFQRINSKFSTSLSLPRINNEQVLVDIAASSNPQALAKRLKNLGADDLSVYGRVISAYVPIEQLETISQLSAIQKIKPSYFHLHSGNALSQGDKAQYSDIARSAFNVDGSGVTIGTLSDSYNCFGGAAADIASNDLPENILVLSESSCVDVTDEGRAMMQIIHDVAPGATQAFHTAHGGKAAYANGILNLANNANADIINDDVIYLDEPMFQDGIIAQAVDTVKQNGVAYFSAAGNNGTQSYESAYRNSGIRGNSARSKRHDFDDSASTDSLMQVTIPANTQILFVLQWNDPFYSVSGAPGADTDMDIILYSASGQPITGATNNNLGGDAVEVFSYTNSSSSSVSYQLAIDHVKGPEPELIKLVYFGNMTINEYATNSASSYGHAIASGSHAVGAARYSLTPAYGVTPPRLESFSSHGGVSILYDLAGNPINEMRQKPNIVAPNGVDNTFFGSDYEGNGLPNFFGTSAATPHAAAVAALIKSFNIQLTADELLAIIDSTAIDMKNAGFDYSSGYGLIDASAALTSMDFDLDTVLNSVDNCPNDANTTQENNDLDSQGDVCDADDDNDGLTDLDEIAWGLNTFIADTDNDGLTDYDEVCFDGNCLNYDPYPTGLDTDANSNDSDADGLLDGIETGLGTNPLVVEPSPQVNAVGNNVNQGGLASITGSTFCVEQCGNVSTNTETTVMLGCQTVSMAAINTDIIEFNVPVDAISAYLTVTTPFGTSTSQLLNINGTHQLGDINADGELNAPDILIAQQIRLNLVTPSDEQLTSADVYPPCAADGLIKTSDVLLIQKKVLAQ